jgi:tripartite-type tricarboxylate transporter receptor subunit TctC
MVQKLYKEVARQLASAELRERLSALGTEAVGSSPEAVAALIKGEIVKWGQRVRAAYINHSQ